MVVVFKAKYVKYIVEIEFNFNLKIIIIVNYYTLYSSRH